MPKGEPKRKKLANVLQDLLIEKVVIREGNEVRKVSKAEAMVRAITLKAMKGDTKAFMTVVSMCQQSGQLNRSPSP
jgi:hypothetical protein